MLSIIIQYYDNGDIRMTSGKILWNKSGLKSNYLQMNESLWTYMSLES